MEDLSLDARSIEKKFVGILPESVDQAEELAACIENEVHRTTGRAVRDLSVEIRPDGVFLRGHCQTYYCKQLAQHAAMRFPVACRLTNQIEVS
jgi:hypothetical protein